MSSKTIIFILLTILIFIGTVYFGLKLYIEKVEFIAKEKAVKENILEGVQLQPNIITIDYSKKISDGSPLVFGAAQSPNSEQAWNKIANSGVNFLRTDFFLEYSIQNTTIDDYKKNINDIQNPNNWNTRYIESRKEIFRNAKNRNMQTLGIVSYAPQWLTYSNTQHGIPKDWEIYQDIVKKIYKINRDYLDYVEIWNEPTHDYFLDLENVPYSKEEAYVLLFEHGSKAIREVDDEINDGKRVKIGAQVSHDPYKLSILESLLKEKDLIQYIDFISYHNYVTNEPSDTNVNKILKENDLQNLPVMLTEWNYNSKIQENDEFKTGNKAIPYTGEKLISFLKMGLLGANYYSLFPVNENSTNVGHGYLAFYRETINGDILLPQSKTWTLLSKTLDLGAGKSDIFNTDADETFKSIGFLNVNSDYGLALVNNTDYDQLFEFRLENVAIKHRAKIEIFITSNNNDIEIIKPRIAYKENGLIKFRYLLPKDSIIGVKFKEEKEWYDVFDSIIQSQQTKRIVSPV